MKYKFKVKDGYRIKYEMKEYPWPCEKKPDRMITIYDDDVLTISENGTCMKHTGLGCLNIQIPMEDLIPWDKDLMLELV